MSYYVYILTTRRNTALYVGVTNDLKVRGYQHQRKMVDGFTQKYNLTKLVYYEVHVGIKEAITREKQIKGGSRQKKIDLVRRLNREWEDLTPKL